MLQSGSSNSKLNSFLGGLAVQQGIDQMCIRDSLYAAGGIPAVQAELAKAGLLDLDVPTVTGKTLGENIAGAHILSLIHIFTAGLPDSKALVLAITFSRSCS